MSPDQIQCAQVFVENTPGSDESLPSTQFPSISGIVHYTSLVHDEEEENVDDISTIAVSPITSSTPVPSAIPESAGNTRAIIFKFLRERKIRKYTDEAKEQSISALREQYTKSKVLEWERGYQLSSMVLRSRYSQADIGAVYETPPCPPKDNTYTPLRRSKRLMSKVYTCTCCCIRCVKCQLKYDDD